MKKFFIFLLAIFIFLFLAIFGIFYIGQVFEDREIGINDFIINDYEDCAALESSVILESYPMQCRTKNGESFTQNIGNELELQDLIFINSPRPNQEISSPLTVSGQARGQWYFEGDFPIKLLNFYGNEIATGVATAASDWTTTNFVSFVGELKFDSPILARKGELVLEKSNPSGLGQNDARLIVPVKLARRTDINRRQKDGCIISGCSNQICSDEKTITSCEYNRQYACYSGAICEKQEKGECGWTITQEIQSCLANS